MNTTMNTVNQTFNWSRFTATLRKEIIENKRSIIFTIICIYGLLTMIMIIGNLVSGMDGDITNEIFAEKLPQQIVGGILSFAICIAASMAFKNLTTKGGRTNLFTSPSSTLEKYLVNILIYVAGTTVAFFICAQLADLTRIAALWFFRSNSFIVPGPINFLNAPTAMASKFDQLSEIGITSKNTAVLMGVSMWIGFIANGGLYLLGSVIWPRLSVLKTFAAVYAIEFVLLLIALPLFAIFGDIDQFGQWVLDFIVGGKFSITMLIWTIVQGILFYSLAWYLFKRKDVISLKWWK